jgi:hypothetical protein
VPTADLLWRAPRERSARPSSESDP